MNKARRRTAADKEKHGKGRLSPAFSGHPFNYADFYGGLFAALGGFPFALKESRLPHLRHK